MNNTYVPDLVDLGELTLNGQPIGRAQLLRCEYDFAEIVGLLPLPFALRRLAVALTETEKQRTKLILAHRKRTEAVP